MAVPVLIAAKDEAGYIERTLEALPRNSCEPIVIANGCQDRTPQLASRFDNVDLIVREEAGKLPAIQAGLRRLGNRAAEPLIFLDADTRPLIGTQWVNTFMGRMSDTKEPKFVIGPVIFDYSDPLSLMIKSGLHNFNQWRSLKNPDSHAASGCNTVVEFGKYALEAVLELPHIWPGEDLAMKEIVTQHGGRATKINHYGAMVITDRGRHHTIWERLRMSKNDARQDVYRSYLADAPPGSVTYIEYKRQQSASANDDWRREPTLEKIA